MTHMIVKHHVADYAKWQEGFDKDRGIRKSNGSLGGQVFQSSSDPSEVFVLLEWDNIENLERFTQSAELKERMKKAGVSGKPDMYFVNLTETPSF